MLELTNDELLTTTRAVRKRLDLQRPVGREVIEECLELALQAPTGSNAQAWHWVVVTDPAQKKALGELYRQGGDAYLAAGEAQAAAADLNDPDTRRSRSSKVTASARHLLEHIDEVPAMVIPCMWGRLDAGHEHFGGVALAAGFWGSIFPAVWSFQLALRSRGLGSSLTTFHLLQEEKAAEILGIPYAKVTQTCLLPIGYTIGADFKPAPRNGLDGIVHWDRW